MTPMIQTELSVKRFEQPDQSSESIGAMGQTDVVRIGARAVSRSTLKPGWRWSEHIKPLAETERCEVFHLGYVLEGRIRVAMHNGSVVELGPGDLFEIPPDHDAEVVGDESCVMIDFGDMADFAVAHHS
jgi:quercetin dioxygenase-like cupin family protein